MAPTVGLEEAAALLRCHPDTVRKMAKAGELPGTKVGRAWVFHTQRLLQWLDTRCAEASLSRRGSDLAAGSDLARRLAAQRERRRTPH
ncbi:MAG TPA: helix-turn-helix domain-containing protein [Steroidobacteraceae bacterium]|nr:helix-turn-helix domain-containing protein [Steroidobacteraceae bacterium]